MLDDTDIDRRLARVEANQDEIRRSLSRVERDEAASPPAESRAQLAAALRAAGYRLTPGDLDRLSDQADYERFKSYVDRYALEVGAEAALDDNEDVDDDDENGGGKSSGSRRGKPSLPRTKKRRRPSRSGGGRQADGRRSRRARRLRVTPEQPGGLSRRFAAIFGAEPQAPKIAGPVRALSSSARDGLERAAARAPVTPGKSCAGTSRRNGSPANTSRSSAPQARAKPRCSPSSASCPATGPRSCLSPRNGMSSSAASPAAAGSYATRSKR